MTTLIGTIGALLILLAFLGNLAGYLSRSNVLYQVANGLGAAVLVWYGLATEGYVFVALEAIWGLAAMYAIYRRFGGRAPEREPAD